MEQIDLHYEQAANGVWKARKINLSNFGVFLSSVLTENRSHRKIVLVPTSQKGITFPTYLDNWVTCRAC